MFDDTTVTPQDETELDFVTIASLASEVGMDRSHMRRFAIKNDVETFKVRTIESKGQSTLAVSLADADLIRDLRNKQGYIYGENESSIVQSSVDSGHFYLILLVPELSSTRIKIGFAANLNDRVAAHRTTCPTLTVLKSWPCKRRWESTVIDCASNDCHQIGVEVFDCDNTDDLIIRFDAFFALMGN